MNNEQLETNGNASQPASNSINQANNVAAVSEVKPTPAPETPTKKKHTGLIIGIIIAVLVLLGGGAFAAFAIIKNQPANIAMESFSNLINAKQIAISGTVTYTPKGTYASIIGPVSINLDTARADVNQASSIDVSVDIPQINKTVSLTLGETMLKDGVIYIKASGVTKLYDEVLSSLLDSSLKSSYGRNSSEAIAEVKSIIANIIKKVDDQWFEISIKDVLDSEYVKQYLNESTKSSITKTYDCSIAMANELSKYSNEFSDLYANNQFLQLEPSTDSYYKISLDADNLANYINALPNTKAVSDYASCNGITNVSNMTSKVTATDISYTLKALPDVYVKIDGFLNHHLTELKTEKDSDAYSFSANLKFAYPSGLNITAPADSHPIMDLVQDIVSDITALTKKM